MDYSKYIEGGEVDSLFRVNREIFTSSEIFDAEMKYIFEGTWVFLALESQIPNAGDYFNTYLGRQPVIVTRDGNGVIHGLINSCRHKGARLCAAQAGNVKAFVCPYHSWSYDLDGTLRAIKDRKVGEYPKCFDSESHDLVKVQQVASYRGLIFGCLREGVEALEDYLGEARAFIDLIVDQSEDGLEVVPGKSAFAYNGNWKLQLENGMDPYHLTSAHQSFMKIVAARESSDTALNAIKTRDFRRTVGADGGTFCFENGHGAIWINNETPERKPVFSQLDNLRQRIGNVRTNWVLNFRNLVLFPSLQLADSESLLLRVIRPISVNRTEVYLYCIAPKNEKLEDRSLRLRQYEDFFNVSGLATPDDAAVYEECHSGFGSGAGASLQGYDRGSGLVQLGADEAAESLGISPKYSIPGPFKVQAEMQFRGLYQEWRKLMCRGSEHDELVQVE